VRECSPGRPESNFLNFRIKELQLPLSMERTVLSKSLYSWGLANGPACETLPKHGDDQPWGWFRTTHRQVRPVCSPRRSPQDRLVITSSTSNRGGSNKVVRRCLDTFHHAVVPAVASAKQSGKMKGRGLRCRYLLLELVKFGAPRLVQAATQGRDRALQRSGRSR
jgi:hypothetical protein